MAPFKNGHGWDKTKIVETVLAALLIVGMSKAVDFFGLYPRVQLMEKRVDALAQLTWNHLHPGEPCPFFNLGEGGGKK